MRVLLVNPFQVELVHKKGRTYNRTWTPLDLAYSGAILENDGVDVAILDANAERIGPVDVARRATGFDKVFITSTSLDRWQCPQLKIDPFLRTVHAVSEVVPEVYVMGSHGTVKPQEMLRKTGARVVVRGEPERTVWELCNGNDLSQVRGIAFLNGKELVSTPEQKPVNMEELPLPAFHLLPMDQYYYEVLGDHFTLFEMSRGCALKCTFCLLKTYGVGVRKKSVDKLANEVEYGVKNFGIKTAYFKDLEFTVLRKQVVEFCRYLIRQSFDFTWCCQTRLDLVDDEMLALMKRAGCRLIHCSVEAGSDEVLKMVDKEITVKEIENGMRKIRKAGIERACFFMAGFLDSTEKDMDDIVRLARRIRPTYPLFQVTPPYPGTKMYEQAEIDPGFRLSDDTLLPEAIEGHPALAQLRTMTHKASLTVLHSSPLFVVASPERNPSGTHEAAQALLAI